MYAMYNFNVTVKACNTVGIFTMKNVYKVTNETYQILVEYAAAGVIRPFCYSFSSSFHSNSKDHLCFFFWRDWLGTNVYVNSYAFQFQTVILMRQYNIIQSHTMSIFPPILHKMGFSNNCGYCFGIARVRFFLFPPY